MICDFHQGSREEERAVVRERTEIAIKDICSSVIPTFEPGRKVDGSHVGAPFEQLLKELPPKVMSHPLLGLVN